MSLTELPHYYPGSCFFSASREAQRLSTGVSELSGLSTVLARIPGQLRSHGREITLVKMLLMFCYQTWEGFRFSKVGCIYSSKESLRLIAKARRQVMLAKLTSKNQLTLPKSITREIGEAEYFEVKVEGGQIILTPVKIHRADAVRSKLADLGLSEQDVADAVAWARQS
ncbi:AbrB/MazE/SpoVT family DNA-binding domain-containing protein [Nostoc sp.]|uniref:AbrB/MazE/SpoVT family DNA-binding domain-containing protein n=1 Tax=Nostoc sp. TaxID=1180 RepID=UPI003FA5D46B